MTFDARQFLQAVFRKPSTLALADLPAAWREEYEERAAIMEYDGGLSRERAEAAALDDITRRKAWTR